jgi:hypothetical protein
MVGPAAALPHAVVGAYDASGADDASLRNAAYLRTHRRRLNMNQMGPWPHIVDCLRSSSPCTARSTRKPAMLARCSPAPNALTPTASIRHIEWQTMHTIRVSWSDATLGQCHDQTWRAGLARTEGVCALTGVPVRRGDAVFRPLALGHDSPINAPHMILANTLRQDKPGVDRNLSAVANSESSSIAPGACANPPSCAAAARPGLRYRYR